MASRTVHELMSLVSISALASPTRLNQFRSSSSLSILEDTARVRTNRLVPGKPGKAVPRGEGTPATIHVGISDNPHKDPSLGLQTEVGSTDAFLGPRPLSNFLRNSQSPRSTIPAQSVPKSAESNVGPTNGVSKPQLLRGSLSKGVLNSCQSLLRQDPHHAYASFLQAYPEYKLTEPVDAFREREYERLRQSDEVYLDYMGAALYPESLISSNSEFLRRTVLGNTHSINPSSHRSAVCAEEARSRVLGFFDAPATEYAVIFTSNATGAMKLIGEAFPFVQESTFILGVDSHNSVNGIRQFAITKGAQVAYVSATPQGGMDVSEAKSILTAHNPLSVPANPPSLFAMTGLSNVTNTKNPLTLLEYASDLGYNTLLDAAALAPSSRISLRTTPVDAMAVSFYKMFGFPTGIGCLVAKKSFLGQLKRPWFAGGTVDIVQVPGTGFTPAKELYEQFEEGTINFTSFGAVTRGLDLLSQYIDYLPLRLSTLTHYLVESLTEIKHDVSGTPVARIVSQKPEKRPSAVGEQSTTGSTVSLVFLEPSGELMSNPFVEYASTKHKISLRTGCMCNPGGSSAILGFQRNMDKFHQGITCQDFEGLVGKELGVVRLSFGLASDFSDAHRLLRFVKEAIACEAERKKLRSEWESHDGHRHS